MKCGHQFAVLAFRDDLGLRVENATGPQASEARHGTKPAARGATHVAHDIAGYAEEPEPRFAVRWNFIDPSPQDEKYLRNSLCSLIPRQAAEAVRLYGVDVSVEDPTKPLIGGVDGQMGILVAHH
jgi:hypothetical protein